MTTTTICLSMIVKNEAHCIVKCLESVKPFINYWVICDTGSSDNTEEIVKKCLKNIPGEFHKHDWVDFSTNRNKSLQLSRNKSDYILIIDADDCLIVDNPIAMAHLSYPSYAINFKHSAISYDRVQLVKNSTDCHYVGILHEYLDLPPGNKTKKLLGCAIHYGANGARSKDPEKFLKDVQVFEKALVTEPDNHRYVFYCAQSYRDAGVPEKALNYYLKRVCMGGWNEEIYVSLLEAAKLTESLQIYNPHVVESAYIRAYNYLPTRLESLCYLSSFCRKINSFDKAYFYAKIGSCIEKPSESLFMETDCYIWKIQDELAISAYYIGSSIEAITLNKYLLNSTFLPKSERARIIQNLSFCESTR